DVRVDRLVLPAQIPSVVDGQFRGAPFGGADPTSGVRTVGPRELADAGSAVCRVGHRSSPRLGSNLAPVDPRLQSVHSNHSGGVFFPEHPLFRASGVPVSGPRAAPAGPSWGS